VAEEGDSRTEVRFRRVVKRRDQGMLLQGGLDDRALDALAASVDQPNLPKPGLVRGAQVFLDHRRDVPRRERVKIDRVFDRDAMRIHDAPPPRLQGRVLPRPAAGFSKVAVTTVVIPPRAEKAPTTDIRRG
jgi:hypothetical protein